MFPEPVFRTGRIRRRISRIQSRLRRRSRPRTEAEIRRHQRRRRSGRILLGVKIFRTEIRFPHQGFLFPPETSQHGQVRAGRVAVGPFLAAVGQGVGVLPLDDKAERHQDGDAKDGHQARVEGDEQDVVGDEDCRHQVVAVVAKRRFVRRALSGPRRRRRRC